MVAKGIHDKNSRTFWIISDTFQDTHREPRKIMNFQLLLPYLRSSISFFAPVRKIAHAPFHISFGEIAHGGENLNSIFLATLHDLLESCTFRVTFFVAQILRTTTFQLCNSRSSKTFTVDSRNILPRRIRASYDP